MGVDYSPVGGIGILLDREMLTKASKVTGIKLDFGREEDDTYCVREQIQDILSEISVPYSEAGSSYSDEELDIYLQVEGETLVEINNNVSEFIDRLKKFDINITKERLVVIEELLVW